MIHLTTNTTYNCISGLIYILEVEDYLYSNASGGHQVREGCVLANICGPMGTCITFRIRWEDSEGSIC